MKQNRAIFLLIVVGSLQLSRLPFITAQPTSPRDSTSIPAAMSQQRTEVTKDDLLYTLTSDKATYESSEPVNLTFTITNRGQSNVQFVFPTSRQYDFIITHEGTKIARWSTGQTFAQGPFPITLGPQHSFVYNTRWLQRDMQNRPILPGQYEIMAISTAADNPGIVVIALEFQKNY